MKINLKGLVAAPHTPMHDDGSLNLPVIALQAAFLRENGVTAAFVCGTTGEGASLTTSERQQVADTWCQERGDLKIIVSVAHTSVEESRELARHAARCGADGIATMAPFFFRPTRMDDLIAYCAAVAAGAADLPFYFYHMPAMTGVSLPMADFLPHAAEHIPNFAGIKFTHENLMDFGQTLTLAGDTFEVLFGRDEILVSALALGATGAIGSTYNFAAPLYHAIITAYNAGDHDTARQEQARAMEMIAVLGRYGGLSAGKAAMKLHGIDCGPVRLPLRRLTATEERGLREDLERLDVLRVASPV